MSSKAVELPLQVLALVPPGHDAEVLTRAFADTRDELTVLEGLEEGLLHAEAALPDLAILDVTLGGNAGLAMVHHLRALAPALPIVVLTPPEHLALASQALALGAAGIIVAPLSGDELLTLVARQRERRAERAERRRLVAYQRRAQRAALVAQRAAELVELSDSKRAAQHLAGLLTRELDCRQALVYLPVAAGQRQLSLVAGAGAPVAPPPYCDDHEALAHAAREGLDVVRLSLRAEQLGLILLGGLPRLEEPAPQEEWSALLEPSLSLTFGLLAEREHRRQGSLKDPSSSAYTFAYFVDVAGREIDKARRHARRFALATVCLEAAASGPRTQAAPDPDGTLVVERLLGGLRDTDVLARVDEQEFFVLLPETGGTGASACRRRMLEQLGAPGGRASGRPGASLDAAIGVATYPHDGADLSRLLQAARHRADASRQSVVRRLELERCGLEDLLEALSWSLTAGADRLDAPRALELPLRDLLALSLALVHAARRGGKVRVLATRAGEATLGATLAASVGHQPEEELSLELVEPSSAPPAQPLEAMALVAEHGAYALLGRVHRGIFRGLHASDPLLVDLITTRLEALAHPRGGG